MSEAATAYKQLQSSGGPGPTAKVTDALDAALPTGLADPLAAPTTDEAATDREGKRDRREKAESKDGAQGQPNLLSRAMQARETAPGRPQDDPTGSDPNAPSPTAEDATQRRGTPAGQPPGAPAGDPAAPGRPNLLGGPKPGPNADTQAPGQKPGPNADTQAPGQKPGPNADTQAPGITPSDDAATDDTQTAGDEDQEKPAAAQTGGGVVSPDTAASGPGKASGNSTVASTAGGATGGGGGATTTSSTEEDASSIQTGETGDRGDVDPVPVAPGPTSTAALGGATPTLGVPSIDVPTVAVPPQTADAIQAQTGLLPEQHEALVRSQVDQVTNTAAALQAQMVADARSRAAQLQAWIDQETSSLLGEVTSALGEAEGLYDRAADQIRQSAGEQRARLDQRKTEAYSAIQGRVKLATSQVAKFKSDKLGELGKLKTTTSTKASKTIQSTAKQFDVEQDALTKKMNAVPFKDRIRSEPNMLGVYLESVRLKVANEFRANAVADFAKSGAAGKQQTLDLEKSVLPSIQTAFDDSSKHAGDVLDSGSGAVQRAQTTALRKIDADHKQATQKVSEAEKTALDKVEAERQATRRAYEAVRQQVTEEGQNRAESVPAGMDSLAAALALQWGQQLQAAQAMLPQAGPMLQDQLVPAFKALQEGLGVTRGEQTQQLVDSESATRTTFAQGFAATHDSVTRRRGELDASVTGLSSELAERFLEMGAEFDRAMERPVPAFDQQLTTWFTNTGTKFNGVFQSFSTTMASTSGKLDQDIANGFGQWKTDKTKVVDTAIDSIAAAAVKAAAPAQGKVQDRAQQAYSAMRGCGTNENMLFTALRGMAPVEPQATDYVFQRKTGGESLDAWLVDDLNAEELAIARAHFNLQHGAAAKAEIDYSISWYGDDEAQIEEVLRGLPEDVRKDIAKDDSWDATRSKLRANLTGTDLLVAESLMANNVLLADAARLKEKIDAAKQAGDQDAIHDALEGMNQSDIDAIARYYVALDTKGTAALTQTIQGNGLADLDKKLNETDGDAARDQMASAVNKTVQADFSDAGSQWAIGAGAVLGGATGAGVAMYLVGGDRTVDADSAALNSALIKSKTGKSDPAVRAARFNKEMKRPDGPKEDKLEDALYGSEDDRLQAHSPDKEVSEAAKKRLAADKVKFKEEYAKLSGKQDQLKGGVDIIDQAIGQNKEVKDDKKGLYKLMAKEGYNTPEVAAKQIELAAGGSADGTDEDAIKRSLKGMNKSEIAQTKDKFKANTKRDLDETLGLSKVDKDGKKTSGSYGELSGQDRMDVEMLMLGDDAWMNDRDRLQKAKLQRENQVGSESSMLGRGVMSNSYERGALDLTSNDLAGFDGKFDKDGNLTDETDKLKFGFLTKEMKDATGNYQKRSDAIADVGVKTVQAVAAVASTIATGGAAAAYWLPAIALAAGGSQMAINATMKGGRYGYEEAAVDGASTVIDAASAGMGAKFKDTKLFAGSKMLPKGIGADKAIDFTAGLSKDALKEDTWKDGGMAGVTKLAYGRAKDYATGKISEGAGEQIGKLKLGGDRQLKDYTSAELFKFGTAGMSKGDKVGKVVQGTLTDYAIDKTSGIAADYAFKPIDHGLASATNGKLGEKSGTITEELAKTGKGLATGAPMDLLKGGIKSTKKANKAEEGWRKNVAADRDAGLLTDGDLPAIHSEKTAAGRRAAWEKKTDGTREKPSDGAEEKRKKKDEIQLNKLINAKQDGLITEGETDEILAVADPTARDKKLTDVLEANQLHAERLKKQRDDGLLTDDDVATIRKAKNAKERDELHKKKVAASSAGEGDTEADLTRKAENVQINKVLNAKADGLVSDADADAALSEGDTRARGEKVDQMLAKAKATDKELAKGDPKFKDELKKRLEAGELTEDERDALLKAPRLTRDAKLADHDDTVTLKKLQKGVETKTLTDAEAMKILEEPDAAKRKQKAEATLSAQRSKGTTHDQDDALDWLTQKQKQGKITDADADLVLQAKTPAEQFEAIRKLRNKVGETHDAENTELQRKVGGAAKAGTDEKAKILAEIKAQIGDKKGQGTASNAIADAGGVDEQLQLAEHLLHFKSLTHKPVTEFTAKDYDALVIAVSAISDAQKKQGLQIRKFIPDDQAEQYLTMGRKNDKGQATISGSVGDANNSKGMNLDETARALGLDYKNSPYMVHEGEGKYGTVGKGLFIEFPATQKHMDEHLRVPLDPQIRAELKKRADAGDKQAEALHKGSIDQTAGGRDVADPFTGKGMTAPGMRYGAEGSTINIEHNMTRAADGSFGTIPAGAEMRAIDDDGKERVVAVYEEGPSGGKWVVKDKDYQDRVDAFNAKPAGKP
jgi:hypothetical protein